MHEISGWFPRQAKMDWHPILAPPLNPGVLSGPFPNVGGCSAAATCNCTQGRCRGKSCAAECSAATGSAEAGGKQAT